MSPETKIDVLHFVSKEFIDKKILESKVKGGKPNRPPFSVENSTKLKVTVEGLSDQNKSKKQIENNNKIVEQNSLEDDYIYIFGDDPGIYGVSNRKSASYQVTVFNVASFEWAKIFADIKTNKPSLILVENHRDVDQELDKILETNYQVINQNQYYTVWKDKHN